MVLFGIKPMKTRKVLICGSRSIKSITENQEIFISLNKIVEQEIPVLIGDAPGVDTLVLDYLNALKYRKVTVFYSSKRGLRNNVGNWPTCEVVGNFRQRDKCMCSLAYWCLAIYDGKSAGTRQNIERFQLHRVKLFCIPK